MEIYPKANFLFLSNVLEGIGHGKVIGIDIFIPNSMKKRIMNKGKLSKRIQLIQDTSTSLNLKKKLSHAKEKKEKKQSKKKKN